MVNVKANNGGSFVVERVYPADKSDMRYGVRVTILVNGKPQTWFDVEPDTAHALAMAINGEALYSLCERSKNAVVEADRKNFKWL